MFIAISLTLALVGAACTSSSESSGSNKTGTTETTSATKTAAVDRPGGPAADVSEELTGGNGMFMGAVTGANVPPGYVQHEYVAAGTATDYKAVGEMAGDGRWTFEPDTKAAYRTRIVVRRPEDMTRASGTVVVEWLNVSGGLDANPDYASLEAEIVRRGDIWVGVSAQLIGIEGGPVLVAVPGTEALTGKGLKALDPARYGSLHHPGDGYSFDIFTQVARAVREAGSVVGGVAPQVVLAAGESQSAIALTTYYDGVQPLTLAFDGFFVHSRAFVALPLVAPGAYADLATGLVGATTPVHFRDDLTAPVMNLQAESDLGAPLDSARARQPDSNLFRLWEVAGTAHADRHLLGSIADSIDCGVPINNGPMHVVAKAAFRGLDGWVRTGTPPPEAARIEMSEGSKPEVQRDPDGIALGGVRTPPVDVPVDVLSGAPGPSQDLMCILLGSTKPLTPARLAQLYPDRATYEHRYASAADAAIGAGFVLADDRDALMAFAQPSRVGT